MAEQESYGGAGYIQGGYTWVLHTSLYTLLPYHPGYTPSPHPAGSSSSAVTGLRHLSRKEVLGSSLLSESG